VWVALAKRVGCGVWRWRGRGSAVVRRCVVWWEDHRYEVCGAGMPPSSVPPAAHLPRHAMAIPLAAVGGAG